MSPFGLINSRPMFLLRVPDLLRPSQDEGRSQQTRRLNRSSLNGEIATGLPPRRTGAFVRINARRFDVEGVAPEVTDLLLQIRKEGLRAVLAPGREFRGEALSDRNQMSVGVTRGRTALLNDHTSLSQIVNAAKATKGDPPDQRSLDRHSCRSSNASWPNP
jgi:hypothetical protein